MVTGTLLAFGVDVFMGLTGKGPIADAAKRLWDITDWILKMGLGAIFGLIGGKVAK